MIRTKYNITINTVEDIPTPNVALADFYQYKWENLEDYVAQERALNLLFSTFLSNTSLDNIMIKTACLNDFYSTNIYKIYPVAFHISKIHDLDNRLSNGDPTLVDEWKETPISDKKKKHLFSFATKYCSHHNPNDFPIYDRFVGKILWHFQKKDRFSDFKRNDLESGGNRCYIQYKSILDDFMDYYGLDGYGYKKLDKFLWQFGKDCYANKLIA